MRYTEITNEASGDGFQYDLKAKFNEFNTRFFDGQLPECKLRFGVLKHKGGQCVCKFIREPGTTAPTAREVKYYRADKYRGLSVDPKSLAITISSTYMREHADIDAILLHEMIHLYFFHIQRFDVSHGREFVAKMREISAKSGIDIPLTDDTKHLEVNPEIGDKRVGVFIYRERGKLMFGLIRPDAVLTPKTGALLKMGWTDRTRKNPNLHVTLKLVSNAFWTAMKLRHVVNRDRITKVYGFRTPEQEAEAMAAFDGDLIFDYDGQEMKAKAEAARLASEEEIWAAANPKT